MDKIKSVERSLSGRLRSRWFRARSKKITTVQDKLRLEISETAWRRYLYLEHLVGVRDYAALRAAIRIALRNGRHAVLLEIMRLDLGDD